MSIEQKFIDGFKEYYSKSRNNAKFYNRMIKQKKFLRIHQIVLPTSKMDVLISFSDTNEIVYPVGDDLQRELFKLIESDWHTFLSIGFSEEEMIEFLPETRYIETSAFTPIELVMPTWDDLLNAPKLGDADIDILQETFEEYHGIHDNYELTCNLHELFCYQEKKPEELELRIVFDDTDQDRKYGDATILLFWKGEFMALCNEYINRYRHSHSYYIANEESWHEMMKVLHSLANIPTTSPIRGAEILDMTQEVENIASVPGFTEKNYE